jgi:hypothetical protein
MWQVVAKHLEPDPALNLGVLFLRHLSLSLRQVRQRGAKVRREGFVVLGVWTNPALA